MSAKRSTESGQTLVLMVIFLISLLGMTALVLDVGSWYRAKRQLQSTADAAALAGAQALPDNPGNAPGLANQYAADNASDLATNDVSLSTNIGRVTWIEIRSFGTMLVESETSFVARSGVFLAA